MWLNVDRYERRRVRYKIPPMAAVEQGEVSSLRGSVTWGAAWVLTVEDHFEHSPRSPA